MVDSDRGITNLHVPSDVIIDASMPAMIRTSGQMWNAAGDQQDTKAVIPDSSYAALYAETIDFCREHGAFDPATMGTTPNVGLMAQKAEEYGSHDKTFEIAAAGHGPRRRRRGRRRCSSTTSRPATSGAPARPRTRRSRDWVRLAVERARATGAPAVFWLDETRAHDARDPREGRARTCAEHDTDGLQIEILPVAEATRFTLERAARGEDTISVTGNVLRDYLTDLFPILELGTSAKMLSIVPLMNGGGLFETGAGGSAPKHVQQLVQGEPPALGLARRVPRAGGLARDARRQGRTTRAPRSSATTLDAATGTLLENGRSPSRKVGELDNRGSHFYLALYWAQELADQSEDAELAEAFAPLAERLAATRRRSSPSSTRCRATAVDLGGYYFVDREKATAVDAPERDAQRARSTRSSQDTSTSPDAAGRRPVERRQRRSMGEYRFVTAWCFDAPVERVYDAIDDAAKLAAWWRGVAEHRAAGGGRRRRRRAACGATYGAACWRTTSRSTRGSWRRSRPWLLEPPRTASCAARPPAAPRRGGQHGRGPRWDVRTTRPWMSRLGPLARPAFAWNHDVVMRPAARDWPGGWARGCSSTPE